MRQLKRHLMLIDEEPDEEVTYKIVGSYESDVSKGLPPVTSPLSKALIGKAVGAAVEVHTPKGIIARKPLLTTGYPITMYDMSEY